MELYPYQQTVRDALLAGHSVILQAPTGAGKTRAALAPFFHAYTHGPADAFPRQCLYSVPMRVLAGQFFHTYRDFPTDGPAPAPRTTIQTGERPEDPELSGDLVFATLDQTLSSALGVPYSLSASRANLNVGAFLGAYLVFDEFHLFPYPAMQTTLQLLHSLQGLTPFTLMTATFSRTLLAGLQELVGGRLVIPDPAEIRGIESAWGSRPRRARRCHVISEPLRPHHVREQSALRTLVVCNTVDRAVEIYRGLTATGCRPVPLADPELEAVYQELHCHRAGPRHQELLQQAVSHLRQRLAQDGSDTPWTLLLHSRFWRPHRQVKEALLQALWSREALAQAEDLPPLVVVATQVVEVGLDISAQVLHTEAGPAASIVQRAGRCARYPGEQGQVFVYLPPLREDGSPNFAPYSGSRAETEICLRTWEALQARDGTILRFQEEQALVDAAHGPADQEMIQAVREDAGRIWSLITDAIVLGEVSTRRDLIRPLDSRTLIVQDAPDPAVLSEESPYRFEGFSLWHGSLRGLIPRLQELQDALGLDWALRYPMAVGDEEESRAPVAYRWLDVTDPDDVGNALLFAIHPRLITYTVEVGFRPGEPDAGDFRSPPLTSVEEARQEFGYALETYPDHIRRMVEVLEGRRGPAHVARARLADRLAWPAARWAHAATPIHLPPGTLARAVRLALALHDVGKLDRRWQRWAARYQEAIGEPLPPDHPPVVHTHYDPDNPLHQAMRRQVRGKPRTHAGESAVAGLRILAQALADQGQERLWRAALMAIAHHHSPRNSRANPFHLDPRSQDAVAQALVAAGGPSWQDWVHHLVLAWEQEVDLAQEGVFLEPPPEELWHWWYVYFLIVRTLRLCDAYSQEPTEEP